MKVRIKFIHIVILTIVTISLSCCTSKDKQNIPSNDAVDLVKTELKMFSKHLPIEGGVGMIITDVNYDDAKYTIHYKYQYTIPGVRKPSDSQIVEAKKIAIPIMKSQPKEKKLLEQGFTFRYDYYNLDGEYLFTQEISLADLKDE